MNSEYLAENSKKGGWYMKKMRKWLALLLAVCLAVPNLSAAYSMDVQAAETGETADDWTTLTESLKEK